MNTLPMPRVTITPEDRAAAAAAARTLMLHGTNDQDVLFKHVKMILKIRHKIRKDEPAGPDIVGATQHIVSHIL